MSQEVVRLSKLSAAGLNRSDNHAAPTTTPGHLTPGSSDLDISVSHPTAVSAPVQNSSNSHPDPHDDDFHVNGDLSSPDPDPTPEPTGNLPMQQTELTSGDNS